MNKRTSESMNSALLAEFWAEVEKIGWSMKANTKTIKARLLRSWSPEKAVSNFFGDLREFLEA